MPLSFVEKDWKRHFRSYAVHERYGFEFKSLYGKRQIEGPVNVFLVSCIFATSFTWNSGHNFRPDFFFNFDHKYRSIDAFWADQAPGGLDTLSGTAYPEAAWEVKVFLGFSWDFFANGVMCME